MITCYTAPLACSLTLHVSPLRRLGSRLTVAQSSVSFDLGSYLSLVEYAIIEAQRADFASRHLLLKDGRMLGSNASIECL